MYIGGKINRVVGVGLDVGAEGEGDGKDVS